VAEHTTPGCRTSRVRHGTAKPRRGVPEAGRCGARSAPDGAWQVMQHRSDGPAPTWSRSSLSRRTIGAISACHAALQPSSARTGPSAAARLPSQPRMSTYARPGGRAQDRPRGGVGGALACRAARPLQPRSAPPLGTRAGCAGPLGGTRRRGTGRRHAALSSRGRLGWVKGRTALPRAARGGPGGATLSTCVTSVSWLPPPPENCACSGASVYPL